MATIYGLPIWVAEGTALRLQLGSIVWKASPSIWNLTSQYVSRFNALDRSMVFSRIQIGKDHL